MNKSEQINELAKALSITQGSLKPAIKDSDNPQFRGSKYADLTAIWEVCREPLSKNGLSVSQFIENEGEFIVVTTMLLHNSGQWLSSSMSLKPTKQDPQGYGSAATYGRRYGLAAILGIVADVDDDGNAATFGTKPSQWKNAAERNRECKAAELALDNAKDTDELGEAWVAYGTPLVKKLQLEGDEISLEYAEQITKRKDSIKKQFAEMGV